MSAIENLGRLTAAAVRLRQLAVRAGATATAIEQRWTRGLGDTVGPLALAPKHGITVNGTEATCDRIGATAPTPMMESSACVACQQAIDLRAWITQLEVQRDAVARTIESLSHVATDLAENITGQSSNGAVSGSP